ncbi:MAG: hypothetical protein ACK43M_23465, partial [Allorhizobium sp.]
MEPELFDSPRALIQEARSEIGALDALVQAFIAEEQWTFIMERDPQTGDKVLKAQFKSELPRRASLLVRRVVSDLRAALDHAVYASACAWSEQEP